MKANHVTSCLQLRWHKQWYPFNAVLYPVLHRLTATYPFVSLTRKTLWLYIITLQLTVMPPKIVVIELSACSGVRLPTSTTALGCMIKGRYHFMKVKLICLLTKETYRNGWRACADTDESSAKWTLGWRQKTFTWIVTAKHVGTPIHQSYHRTQLILNTSEAHTSNKGTVITQSWHGWADVKAVTCYLGTVLSNFAGTECINASPGWSAWW